MKTSNYSVCLMPSDTGIPQIPIIGKSISSTAYTKLNRHHHDGCIEVVYLQKGEQMYRVNDTEDYYVSGGEVFFTFPYEWHDTADLPQNRSVLYWFHLEIFNMDSEYINILNLTNEQSFALAKEILSLKNRKFKAGDNIKNYFEELFKINIKNDPISQCRIENIILSILFEIINLSRNETKLNTSDDIRTILKFIEENISSEFKIKELARRINLSESRFKQKFKEQIGSPPIDYIQNRRIELAKEYLKGDDNITQIAFSLGFNTSQYFSETFKKYTGKTPREYRKQYF